MTQRALTLLAMLVLAGCATSSPSVTLVAPQGEATLVEPSPSESPEQLLPHRGVLRGGAHRECPMRIFPVQADVAPMPAMRIDSTRRHTIRVIPPGCTPRPA